MTDKEKIRAKVKERLDYNQQHENDYAGTNYFWQKKEDKEILHIIDSMQEEPNILPVFDEGYWERLGEETVNEDLGEYINELSKQFPEVSFAKLSRIAVRVAKWQKLKDMGITNNAKGLVTNILNSSDKSLDIYATEVAFIMLPANLTENYHMTNRDRISDAVRLGAKWQKQQDQSTIELVEDNAMLAGMEKMKEQIMAKAIDGTARPDDNEIWCNLTSSNLKDGDKVKIIVTKED